MYNQLKDIDFVLGSQSPRRQEIFRNVGLSFRVAISEGEELIGKGSLGQITEELARQKSEDLMAVESECLVTADTLVGLDGMILAKPKDGIEAKEMLRSLQENWHQVITGVHVKYKGKSLSFHEETQVYINKLQEQDLDHYITQYSPLDKAGAYGIQDWLGLTHVGKIQGCYYNVMGFPMPKFYIEIQKLID